MTKPGTIPTLTFFDHEKGKLGLFELMDVKERAASILGGKTDITTRNSLHPKVIGETHPGLCPSPMSRMRLIQVNAA